jgi:hypothetical protein
MSDERYATLANSAPWITPGNPGVFAPPAGATGPQIEAAKDVWCELKFSFELCQATERALIAQVVDSVDTIYLRPLLNRVTGQYSTALRPVFVYLFDTHGKVTPQQVKSKEQAVCSMTYDLSIPIDTVFTTVNDLADLSEHSGSLMTDRQKMDVAFVVLAKISLAPARLAPLESIRCPQPHLAQHARALLLRSSRPHRSPYCRRHVPPSQRRHDDYHG